MSADSDIISISVREFIKRQTLVHTWGSESFLHGVGDQTDRTIDCPKYSEWHLHMQRTDDLSHSGTMLLHPRVKVNRSVGTKDETIWLQKSG